MQTKAGLFLILLATALLGGGCTSVLWQDDTFSRKYTPAVPSDIHLYYSERRKDVLVQYNEKNDDTSKIRTRFYWIEPNDTRITREERPHFVSSRNSCGLTPIPVTGTRTNAAPDSLKGLRAYARPDDYLFTLYLSNNEMDAHELPRYRSSSQRVKQVLLTPFAVTIDATIFGAAVFALEAASNAYYYDNNDPYLPFYH